MSHPSTSRIPRIAHSTAAFVLTLCIPYVAGSPLPSPAPTDSGLANGVDYPTANTVSLPHLAAAADVLRSAGGHTMDLFSRSSSDTISTAALNSTIRPTFSFAAYDVNGYYTIPGDYVRLRQQFNPGFIVLSYAIAFVGSLCTLELLIRRTTNAGWRNQVLLASAGVTFGAVSTFAMHFIFNNSLSLHHPLQQKKDYPSLHLAYDAGYTILSLVASCLAMTIAFFIMGTSYQDWWCIPGVRRRRGSAFSEASKHGGDEYGRWKDSHKKVLRRGTIGMGALLNRAGSVAKWSLMDTSGDDEKVRKWGSKGGKDWEGPFEDNAEELIRQDKKLEELDFRLGRSAVKLELERRHESPRSTGNNSPDAMRRKSTTSIRPMPSNPSLPRTPPMAFYPPTTQGQAQGQRRDSAPMGMDLANNNSSEVFSPGFNFPPRTEDPVSSTTHLITSSAPSSAHPLDPSSNWPGSELPPAAVLPDLTRRRASLPVAVFTRPETSSSFRPANTLTRIQSLPEADPELGQSNSSRSGSFDKNLPQNQSPTLSVSAKLGDLGSSRGDSPPVHKKHVEFKGRAGFTKIEKFLGFDVVTRDEIIKIFITGTIAGFGVAAMHYIGQLSISGMPYIAYKAPYVVGSIIIASGAVIIALYIMFIMLRPKLKHTWASKIVVALILAVAVCAMHFCGMMGTIYAWPRGQGISRTSMLVGTNRAITAIVACLAFVACIACAVFFVLHSLKIRRERARRRRVVVAAVFLDNHDRILVNSTDGMLPMCDIASLTGHGEMNSSRRSLKSNNLSFGSDSTVLGMDLTPGHDAFVSALKMSWAWKNPALAPSNSFAPVSEQAIASGQQTLAGTIADIRRGSLMTMESSVTGGRQMRLSVAKFLERFAISSGQLAVQLIGQQDGISRLGVLYDQILTTGWVKLANSSDTVSKGQLIFLVRRVASVQERNDLIAKHFIFADPEAVASSVHKTLSVPFDHTVPLLEDIRLFCDSTLKSTLRAGVVYAGVAVVQATPFDGLRVLLEQDNRAQLPMRELCMITDSAGTTSQTSQNGGDALSGTLEELGEAISWLDGMSLLNIIHRNMIVSTGHDPENDTPGGPRVAALLLALERAIVPMLDTMLDQTDMIHILPRLHLHPALVPLTPGGTSKTAKLTGNTPPYVIVFYANYDAAANTFTDKWLPFSLFRAQNACVMAPRIQAAMKAERIDHDLSLSLNDTYGSSRRPSKVQFELSDSNSLAFSPASIPAPVPPSAPEPSGMFTGFAFPPKTAPVLSTSGGGGVGEPLSQAPSRPVVGRTVSGGGTARRSSLAGRSRFGSESGPGLVEKDYAGSTTNGKEKALGLGIASVGAMTGHGGQGQGQGQMVEDICLGVAGWDTDWLLNLLRTKLRAEA